MADKTLTVALTGTYRWDGKKYGPGQRVKVPAGLAEWLGVDAVEPDDAPEPEHKPTRRTAKE